MAIRATSVASKRAPAPPCARRSRAAAARRQLARARNAGDLAVVRRRVLARHAVAVAREPSSAARSPRYACRPSRRWLARPSAAPPGPPTAARRSRSSAGRCRDRSTASRRAAASSSLLVLLDDGLLGEGLAPRPPRGARPRRPAPARPRARRAPLASRGDRATAAARAASSSAAAPRPRGALLRFFRRAGLARALRHFAARRRPSRLGRLLGQALVVAPRLLGLARGAPFAAPRPSLAARTPPPPPPRVRRPPSRGGASFFARWPSFRASRAPRRRRRHGPRRLPQKLRGPRDSSGASSSGGGSSAGGAGDASHVARQLGEGVRQVALAAVRVGQRPSSRGAFSPCRTASRTSRGSATAGARDASAAGVDARPRRRAADVRRGDGRGCRRRDGLVVVRPAPATARVPLLGLLREEVTRTTARAPLGPGSGAAAAPAPPRRRSRTSRSGPRRPGARP